MNLRAAGYSEKKKKGITKRVGSEFVGSKLKAVKTQVSKYLRSLSRNRRSGHKIKRIRLAHKHA
jgi:hypothetical protein